MAYDFNNKPTLQKHKRREFYPRFFQKKLHTIYTDAILKYKGFTTTAGYIYRKADNNKLYLSGQSLYATASYVFKKKSRNRQQGKPFFCGKIGNIPTVNEYTMGLAYYVYKNAFKLETDYTILQNKLCILLAGLWRFQMQWAF